MTSHCFQKSVLVKIIYFLQEQKKKNDNLSIYMVKYSNFLVFYDKNVFLFKSTFFIVINII